MTLDGAHLSSPCSGVLLTAAALDGNDQIVLLGWAVVTQESDEWWHWFLNHWKAQLVSFESLGLNGNEAIAFCSDRAKGLINAVGEAFPRAHHYHCTQHLAENFHVNYCDSCATIFRKLVFAQNAVHYKALRRELLHAPQKAFDSTQHHGRSSIEHYLDAIEHNGFVRCYVPVNEFPRFGHTTSNMSESLNGIFTEERQLPVFHCVNALWRDTMSKFYERREHKFPLDRWTKAANDYYQEQLLKSRRGYIVTPSEPNVALVNKPASNESFVVDLNKQQCTCLDFQDRRIPCRHAIAVCREFQLEPELYIDETYSVEVYRATYAGKLRPIVHDDLEPDDKTLPPLIEKRRDRRRISRIRRRKSKAKDPSQHQPVRHCTRCGHAGHNRASRNCEPTVISSQNAPRSTRLPLSRPQASPPPQPQASPPPQPQPSPSPQPPVLSSPSPLPPASTMEMPETGEATLHKVPQQLSSAAFVQHFTRQLRQELAQREDSR